MTDELLNRLRQSPVVGRYFEDDGQLVVVAGGSDDAPPADPPPADPPAGDPPADPPPADPPGPELTPEQQALVDAQVTKQVGAAMAKKIEAEKKKWEAEVKTAADREKMEETDRLKAEKADADKAVEDARREVLTTRAEVTAERLALKADVDPDRVTRFLEIAKISDQIDGLTDDGKPDEKAITKLVADTLKDWPEFKKAEPGGRGRSGGDFNGHNGETKPANLQDAVAARLG